jgi:hypothetical protein
MLSTQVVLGSMTPVGVVTQPPAIPLSTDSLPAQGLLTHANTDHPTIPATGSTDQAQTLSTTGIKHRGKKRNWKRSNTTYCKPSSEVLRTPQHRT